MPALVAMGVALLLLIGCGGGRNTNDCATPLTYVTNPQAVGDDAVRHASEYRLGLFVGADDFVVSALVDTASANLIINESNYDFSADTAVGSAPYVYASGNIKATAIAAKDSFDVACLSNTTSKFALAAKDAATDNIVGLSFPDPAHRPHEKKGPAFFDQLVKNEGITDLFSLALCRSLGPSRLLFGRIDEGMKPFVGNFIPMIEKTSYVVPAKTLRRADNKKIIAEFPQYDAKTHTGTRTIIDSASSFLLLPVNMAQSLSDEVKGTANSLNLIQRFPEGFFRTERSNSTKLVQFANLAQINQFPTLEITFVGSDGSQKNLEIPPDKYFKIMEKELPLLRTFAVRETAQEVVLGQPFLESHYTVFDRKNARIGFANIDLACAE